MHITKKAVLGIIISSVTVFYVAGSPAQDMRWEAGVGLVGVNLPLYPGSSQDAAYLIRCPADG